MKDTRNTRSSQCASSKRYPPQRALISDRLTLSSIRDRSTQSDSNNDPSQRTLNTKNVRCSS